MANAVIAPLEHNLVLQFTSTRAEGHQQVIDLDTMVSHGISVQGKRNI